MELSQGFSVGYEQGFEQIMQKASKSQLERFKEAARKLETDDDEERFNEKLRKLAKQKPDEKPSDD